MFNIFLALVDSEEVGERFLALGEGEIRGVKKGKRERGGISRDEGRRNVGKDSERLK